jgi:hypothetical protein
MAESLNDEQLVAELQSYGETVALPIKPNRRPILMKKLNHLRSRNKSPVQKGKGRQAARRSELGAFSSDDSDDQPESDATAEFVQSQEASRTTSTNSRRSVGSSNTVSDVVNRSLRRRSRLSPPGVRAAARNSPDIDELEFQQFAAGRNRSVTSTTTTSQNQRRRRTATPDVDQPAHSNASPSVPPRLYPELPAESDTPPHTNAAYANDESLIPNFESSDSDIEGSSYEVANKSVNTSFSSRRGGRSPSSNHVAPAAYLRASSVRASADGPPSRTSSSGRFNKRRFYPERVSLGLVALVLAFFLVIFVCYMVVRKELFIGLFFTEPSSQGQTN